MPLVVFLVSSYFEVFFLIFVKDSYQHRVYVTYNLEKILEKIP